MEAYNFLEKEMPSAKPLANIITSQTNRGVKYVVLNENLTASVV
jgi:hypothetical protein